SLRTPGAPSDAPREDPAEKLWCLWRQGQRPEVDAFLQGVGALSAPQVAAVLRVDQRERWRTGEHVLAESYLKRHPVVQADPDGAVDLVYNELLLREKKGERPTVEGNLTGFPQYPDELKRQTELPHAVAPDSNPGPSAPAS